MGHAPFAEGVAKDSESHRAGGSCPPGGHFFYSVGVRSKSWLFHAIK